MSEHGARGRVMRTTKEWMREWSQGELTIEQLVRAVQMEALHWAAEQIDFRDRPPIYLKFNQLARAAREEAFAAEFAAEKEHEEDEEDA